jgi:ABC-2 type transport system permease protein
VDFVRAGVEQNAPHAAGGIEMKPFLQTLVSDRFGALLRKEFEQIRRDRRLTLSLIVPPILQLLLFSVVLNATVSDLRLGVIDDSRTPLSRDLVANLTESRSFRLAGYYYAVDQLGDAISRGNLDAGVVIPRDFARDLERGRPVTVQLLLNAMNANTATIARSYAQGVISTWDDGLPGSGLHARFAQVNTVAVNRRGQAIMTRAFLFNPGLINSWFVITGILGLLIILNGSIVASAAMVKEREAGTIEQLVMSPATTTEIIIAKMAPLFVLLLLMVIVATAFIRFAFNVPFHGNLLVIFCGASLCILSGISLGTVIATFSRSAQQAQLTSFFVNPLLTTASGAVTPAEAVPQWLQPLVWVNPIRHFSVIARSNMIKGTGFAPLWPNFLVLGLFTLMLVVLSVWRFRKMLS